MRANSAARGVNIVFGNASRSFFSGSAVVVVAFFARGGFIGAQI